ncbi:alpha/beta fold hydrolase [Chitinophaga ginsengisegetis]|uniref:alpha/beta fold hydrolase n=1 Tax=Chitinophaga ginsengisegetis TaxID=393003 RepID=UPI000DBAC101|nr:alpha/beta hydrolase [Chitinophaga ginsengisegetis]MDR6568995.1 pimeloyl-ACP methyl ester carboxylesterase [Chitinophaga ginsengisegetis]MDR6648976.1 pimeloyl-ACP methyl ester carboxylesterase [Chitinophaga ginsengisegetis]MDR6655076.1 pimeloyl-ACP methyl ester carboxylesterase [Chitinophaga ginsengisegetis]
MSRQILNRSIKVDGIDIFYREAGDRKHPSLLLLHGFPTSSVMFKNLMTALSDRFHLVAPDYPGFGFSAFPDKDLFEYSFGNISAYINKFTDVIGLKSFTIYLHDYGCPIGLRLCVNHPEKIERIIVQNGNAYDEGIGPQWDETIDYWQNPTPEKKEKVAAFLSEEGVKMQYTAGVPEALLSSVSPELWRLDWELMKRPGNIDMQFELNCDFGNNISLFPVFQEYFRVHQPPALIIWGKYDVFFGVEEAYCYQKDLPRAQTHIIDGSHMVLETNFDEVLHLIRTFLISK